MTHITNFRFEDLVSQSSILLQTNENRIHSLVTILSDVYLQLISDPKQHWKIHDAVVAECVLKLLTVLFQTGKPSNVKIATQKLKVKNEHIGISSSEKPVEISSLK